MPSLPPTPSGVIRARLIHTIDEDTSVGSKVDYAYTGSVPDSTVLGDLAAEIATNWAATMTSYLATPYALTQVFAIDLSNPSTPEGLATVDTGGGRTGVIPSLATCLVITRHVDRRYRGSRPKVFLPYGVETDVVNANQWSSAFLAAAQSAWTSFEADNGAISAGGTNLTGPVAVSYYHGFTVVTSPTTGRSRNVPTARTTPLVLPVTSMHASATLGSQRRRLRAL